MAEQEPMFDRRLFHAGQRIFNQGDPGDCLYYVERGRVLISRGPPDKEVSIAEIEQYGIFGEMALIEKLPRSAHATAITQCLLHVIPGHLVKARLEKADPFVRKLIQILSRNLRQTIEPLPHLNLDDKDAP